MSIVERPLNTPDWWSGMALLDEAWAACGWSREGQIERHVAVVQALDVQEGESVLDWGCGTGELSELLPEDVRYVGYDWSSGMVIRAESDHPSRTFQLWPPSGMFDLVACVGCFNLPHQWSKQRTWHTLRHLWDQTMCRTLAVSLYCGDDPNCLSYTGSEAATAGAQLGYHVTVDQIRVNDLLLVVKR